MRLDQVWDKIMTVPGFNPDNFDLDGLCDEFKCKAKVSFVSLSLFLLSLRRLELNFLSSSRFFFLFLQCDGCEYPSLLLLRKHPAQSKRSN